MDISREISKVLRVLLISMIIVFAIIFNLGFFLPPERFIMGLLLSIMICIVWIIFIALFVWYEMKKWDREGR